MSSEVTISILDGGLGLNAETGTGIHAAVGHSTRGTHGQIYTFGPGDINLVRQSLGRGPLAESVATALRCGSKAVHAVRSNASAQGGFSANQVYSRRWATTFEMYAGTPNNTQLTSGGDLINTWFEGPLPTITGSLRAVITTSGAPGTAAFKVSLDNGSTFLDLNEDESDDTWVIPTNGVNRIELDDETTLVLVWNTGESYTSTEYASATYGGANRKPSFRPLTDAPTSPIELVIITGGARGTAEFQYRWGGGPWFDATVTAAANFLTTPSGEAILVQWPVATYVVADRWIIQPGSCPTISEATILNELPAIVVLVVVATGSTVLPEAVGALTASYSTDFGTSWNSLAIDGATRVATADLGDENLTFLFATGTYEAGDTFAIELTGVRIGENGPVDQVAVEGQPVASDHLIVEIVAGGALGTVTWRYSLNGGGTWSGTYATTAGGDFTTSNESDFYLDTGLTLTFEDATHSAGDRYEFRTFAPRVTLSDLTNAEEDGAVDILLAHPSLRYERIHVTGHSDPAAWVALDALAEEATAAYKRWIEFHCEAPWIGEDPLSYVAAVERLTDGIVSSLGRVTVISAIAPYTSPLSSTEVTGNLAAIVQGLLGRGPVARDVGAVKFNAVPLVTGQWPGMTNALAERLHLARTIALRTLPGRPGRFFRSQVTLANSISDFHNGTEVRLVNHAAALTYARGVENLRTSVPVAQDGTIDPGFAANLEDELLSSLNPIENQFSHARVTVPLDQDILSEAELDYLVEIIPLGRADSITITIGLTTSLTQEV